MKTLLASLALLIGASSAASAAGVNVGRILFVEPRDSFVVVQFPSGQRYLHVEQRDFDRYLAHYGRDVVFDDALLPQWGQPVPPSTTRP
jgi:hypothetical protein